MATAKIIENHSKGAEISHGAVICKEKLLKLFEEFSVPKGLFRVDEIEEVGFNRSTGFFWLRQKKKTEHKFKSVGTLTYEAEITSFMEPRHMANITGLKGKNVFISAAVNDILVGVPSSDKIKFSSSVGLTRVQPISAFEPEDGNTSSK